MKLNPPKTVLLTGGAGFVGSAIVRKLLQQQCNVVVIDNFSFGRRENLPSNREKLVVIDADIIDTNAVYKAFETYAPDVVIHAAALHFIPYCNANPTKTIRVNVEGTQSVLLACRKHKIKKLLFFSTAAVYAIKDTPHTETSDVAPVDIYGYSKLFGEQLVHMFYEQTGVPCALIRLFNAYGPRETNPHVIPEIIQQLKVGSTLELGNIKAKRDFVHTTDIAEACFAIACYNLSGCEVFNCGTGYEYSIEEIVDIIGNLTSKKIDIKIVEYRKRSVERMHLCSNIDKIIKLVGWKPNFNIIEGFRDLLRVESLI